MAPSAVPSQPTLAQLTKQPHSFTELVKMREQVLSWICYDRGLSAFLFPNSDDTPTLSPDQQCAYIKAIVNNFLNTASEPGRIASTRTYTREAAACLHRFAESLASGNFTHRDIAKVTILLDGLWDDTNQDLNDQKWARCSMRFDTALISLRLTYVITFLNSVCPTPQHSTQLRKRTFTSLIDKFFQVVAPTDEPLNKHSQNFNGLVNVWKLELSGYTGSSEFEQKLSRLEDTVKPAKTARSILMFLRELGVNESWIAKANQMEKDLKSGRLVSRDSLKKPKKRIARPPPQYEDLSEPESGSFEPVAKDSDFEVSLEEEDDDDDEDFHGSRRRTVIDSPETRRVRRARKSSAAAEGEIVRRSLRVAHAGIRRKQSSRRTRRHPQRFSDMQYDSSKTGTPDLPSRKSPRLMSNSMEDLRDEEPETVHEVRKVVEKDDDDIIEEERPVTRSSPRVRKLLRQRETTAQRTVPGRKTRGKAIEEEKDEIQREEDLNNEVERLSQKLNPDSQKLESGLSDLDEVTANVVKRKRLLKALADASDVRVKFNTEDDDDDI